MSSQVEVSIKVHCIVSCFCEIVKRNSSIDTRPFYFGVWDAAFDVTSMGEITYYQHNLTHDYFLYWFEQLFGPKVHEWYDRTRNQTDNLTTLLTLMDECPKYRSIVVQIDMSYMPERENKFHQKPFPHFLIISKTEREEEWLMIDPDFRWEGVVQREQVIEAFLQNPFGGGFYIDALSVHPPAPEPLQRFYAASFDKNYNDLTWRLKELIRKMALEQDGYTRTMLVQAVKQLPVIAIRKYSYEHALMYLNDQVGAPYMEFEHWCDKIEQLVQGFSNVQYRAMKLAMTGRTSMLPGILQSLDEMDIVELDIKQEVQRKYLQWKQNVLPRNGGTA
ncbi:MAG: hypothetical protein K0Q81_267 [Paenibacillus sp.]|nr:hypothetical protein [Paenibacillus sp.]